MLKNHFTLNANTQYKSSCNHHNETGGRFLGSKHFRLRGILRCSIPLSVVAKVTYDKRQLASQAFRQILKHLPSSELEEVLHYLSVACRRLPFIILTLARLLEGNLIYPLRGNLPYRAPLKRQSNKMQISFPSLPFHSQSLQGFTNKKQTPRNCFLKVCYYIVQVKAVCPLWDKSGCPVIRYHSYSTVAGGFGV